MNLSIRTRLYGGFIILLAFLLISFLVAGSMLHHLNARMNHLVLHDVEKMRMAGLLDQSVLEISRLERNIILSDNPEEMQRFAAEITQTHARLQLALEGLHGLSTSDEEQRILAQIAAAVVEWIAIDREVQRLGLLNSNVRAVQMSETTGRAAMRNAMNALEKLHPDNALEEPDNDRIEEVRRRARRNALSLEMQRLLTTLLKDEIHMILTTDEEGMAQQARVMEATEIVLSERRDALQAILRQPLERELLTDYDRHVAEYLEISRQVRALTQENGNHRAIRLSQKLGRPLLLQLRDLLHALSERSETLMNEAKQQSNRDYLLAFSLLSVMLCLSFVLGTLIALRISRDVNQGLTVAIRTVEAVARGDLGDEATIVQEAIRDEFGQLMQAMRRLVDAENRVADMAQRLAQEDLSVTVEERSSSDRLLAAMKHLALALRERAELRRMLLVSEKMSSIGQFAVRVAHEINNPLSTAAMGLQNVRLLLPPPQELDKAVSHRLNQVENNIERATRVARQMLEYSWTGQPECADFDLMDELAEVLELVQAEGRPVEVVLEREEPLRLWGDRMKIGQVLRNLIQNAMDATPEQDVVQVSAHPENGWLVVRVRDRGAGLTPDVEGKIFEPFFTTKKAGIGVGLGLPICYSIVRQHHGTLEVTNAPDGGVLATLRLPLSPHLAEGS